MEDINFALISNFFIAVLAIINPVGNLPIFIEQVSDDSNEVRRDIATLLSLIIFIIMVLFYATGETLLSIFGITIPAFRIAGGILILRIGLKIIGGGSKYDKIPQDAVDSNSFRQAKKRVANLVVPIAIPIFVGPGVATTVVLYSQQITGVVNNAMAIGAMFLVSMIVATMLLISNWFSRVFGKNFMMIVSRTMGLILCAIAVQFMIEGINQLFPGVVNPDFVHTVVNRS